MEDHQIGTEEYARHTAMMEKTLKRAKEAAIDLKDGDVLCFLNIVGSIAKEASLEIMIEGLNWSLVAIE